MTVTLAREVAARVAVLDGVMAVALGGSAGRGRADERSDLDLAVYYDPARPFSVAGLAAVATELDDRHAPEVVSFGDWGPWINGGAWTRIRGTKVDLLYRDLNLVDRVLDDCAAGRTTSHYQPGHPPGPDHPLSGRLAPGDRPAVRLGGRLCRGDRGCRGRPGRPAAWSRARPSSGRPWSGRAPWSPPSGTAAAACFTEEAAPPGPS